MINFNLKKGFMYYILILFLLALISFFYLKEVRILSAYLFFLIVLPWLYYRRKKELWISFIVIILLFSIIEISFFINESIKSKNRKYKIAKKYIQGKKFKMDDEILGYKLKPGLTWKESKIINDEYVYKDIVFSTNKNGLRKSFSRGDSFHALFFGDSIVFGMGVRDHETFPSQFGILNNNFKVYNFGVNGWSTAQMLFQLKDFNLMYEIATSQPRGFALYSYIRDHIYRNTGDIYAMTSYRKDFPLFSLKNNESFKYYQNFYYNTLVKIYCTLNSISPFFRYLSKKIRFKFMSDKNAIKTTANIIISAKEQYDKIFNGKFIVILWPRLSGEESEKKLLENILLKNGIVVLKVPPMKDNKKAIIHKWDRHPSVMEYGYVAQKLGDFIKKINFDTLNTIDESNNLKQLTGGISTNAVVIDNNHIKIWGWFLSNKKIDKIEVYINNNFLGLAKMNVKRLDVFKKFPQYKKMNSGFLIEGNCNNLDNKATIRIEVYSNGDILGKRVYQLKNFLDNSKGNIK